METPTPSANQQQSYETDFPDWTSHTDAWAFLQSLNPKYKSRYLTRQRAQGGSSTGYLFGRRQDSDFIFDDDKISKYHCAIHMESGWDSDDESGISIYLEDFSTNGTFVNGKPIKHVYRIIMPPNFEVVKFHTLYRMGKQLGKGNFATVYKAYDRTELIEGSQPRYVAVKCIKKSKLERKPRLLPSIIQEIGILMSLKAHPFVIQIEKVFDEPKNIYMVLEYVNGGDLFDLVSNNGCLTEDQSRFIFFQLFSGIKFLHERHVIHRDLKPENVLVVDAFKLQVKITDFGLAKVTSAKRTMLDSQCGTPNYVAPEILHPTGLRSYGKECDLWSLGVMLYICLCGFPPFNADIAPPSLKEQILRGLYTYPAKYWDDISEEAKDLVDRLLTVDPKSRINVDEAREHVWMLNDIEGLRCRLQDLPEDAVDLLRQYEMLASLGPTQITFTQS
ncbi:kinase-like domain-containing protein [Halteromyces radiatus]|uniref:kinase-like domain-containing protein n=1 Tax=Halteromyces radiatus TaxID=101107 RepID=UPI00221F4CF1|nr:kinase-like domain-containing protein [Halteromyces radiatus]KAI8089035.1 kinase-like domain-containing protein [Halteromyces radiatus]